MTKFQLGFMIVFLLLFPLLVFSLRSPVDLAVMLDLRSSLNSNKLDWTDADPCLWDCIVCKKDRVTEIVVSNSNLSGTLPLSICNLTSLERLDIQGNAISGNLPTFGGLSSLQILRLSNNLFTTMPADFFLGLSSIQAIDLDGNPFSPWEIPESFKSASSILNFSANSANIKGNIPDFFGEDNFPALASFHVALNYLEGFIPESFATSSVQSLRLNGNLLSGILPDFSTNLRELDVRDNSLCGLVPSSLTSIKNLQYINISNNYLQGSIPVFNSKVIVDIGVHFNSFCLSSPGDCDPRVTILLSIAKSFGYPIKFAKNWRGNDPCVFTGISCNGADVTAINFRKNALSGTISSAISRLEKLQRIVLANNNLTGTIPAELSSLTGLKLLDVSNNDIYGRIPNFKSNVLVITSGNPSIGKDKTSPSKSVVVIVIVSLVFCGIFVCSLVVLSCFCRNKSKKRWFGRVQNMNEMIVLHPSPEILKSSTANVAGSTDKKVITVTLMREATDNFNKNNILGHGGSATVYRGKLEDGSMVAVKRLKPQGQKSKEFMDSEIEVLSKVCHRNVISLHGYCSDDHESLLVYEYMPQGTLSQHLFKKNEGSKPLDWSRRLIIALDIAKGVHYLHNLANISMIHRDLKSSNILLSEDMRAKVADFGLVRNAPTGNSSYASRVAGTYGYLAPEYATTAKISTKIDVYSYGAILMELITGRKALDESQCDEQMHLVSWFSKIQGNKQEFGKAVDSTINITEEIEGTIESVAELACLCCLWRADDRPTMSYVVNQLSALVEYWEPVKAEDDDDDWYDIELCNRLPPAILEWQTSTGSSISLEAPASYLQARSMVAWNTI